MPEFNPSIPEADATRTPEYLNFSKTISPYELRASADKSKGIALTALGKTLEEGVNAYGAVKEQSIKDEAYQKLQPIIDDTTAALEGAVQNKQEGIQSQRQSLIDNNQEPSGTNAPAAVQSGLDKIGYLTGVGKLKPDLQTHLSGQIAAVQKEMRAENPGFIPFIDREVSKVTGGIDANSHLRNLMTQIASADQTKQGYQKEVVNKLLSVTQEGAGPEYPVYAAGVMNGTMSVEEGMKRLGEANRKLFKNREAESDINLKIKRKEDASGDAEVNISGRSNDYFYGMFHAAITGGGQINNESIEQYLQEVSEGRIKVDPEKLNQLADTLEGRKTQALVQLRQQFTQHAPGQLSVYDALHNPEKFDKLLNDAADEYTKNVQLIRSGNGLGLAHSLARNNQDIATRNENEILNDPTIGRYAQKIPALQKIFGNTKQFQDMIDKTMVNPKVAAQFQGWFQDAASSMMASNGKIPMSTVIENGIRIGQTPSGKAAGQQEMARTYNEVLKLGDYLETGPNANMKSYLARSMYLPNNYNLIDKFDSKDQVDVLNKFVSKGKVDAITQLNDPKLAQAQKNWGETTFFKVYKNELGDLKDIIQGKENLLHASWDTETNHWKVDLAEDVPLNPAQRFLKENVFKMTQDESSFVQRHLSGYDRVQETVGRINSALDNMSYMEKTRGGSINGFMLDVMNALGANPSRADGPQGTIEDKMARAIMSGRKPPEQPEGGGKMNFGPEKKSSMEESEGQRAISNLFSSGKARKMGIAGGLNSHMSTIESQGHQIQVNQEAAPHFKGFLDELESRGYKVNELLGHSIRAKVIAGRQNTLAGYSEHAYGNAIDINPDINQQGSTRHNFPKDIGEIAARHGLVWGGHWTGKYADPMHFEWGGGRAKEASK